MVWFVDLSPALLVFFSLSLAGTMFVLFSLSVVGVWFGLECNFFGFVPLLNGKTTEESEGAMKYFIVQGLGSGLIFLSVCLMMAESWEGSSSLSGFLSGLLFVGGLMVKVGLFPFHFWFPSVMGGSSWFNCFMLSTWQKLGVFFVISGMSLGGQLGNFILLSGVLTSVVGGLGGVGQIYFRSIMAYSSLVHSGWMVVVCLISEIVFLVYYLVYMSIVFFLFRMVSYFQKSSVGVLSLSGFMSSGYLWVWVLMGLLSLGGLPPLLGSVIKLLGIMVCLPIFKMGLVFLISSSVVGLFYYLSVVFSSSLFYSSMSGFLSVDMEHKVFLVKSSFWSFMFNSVLGVVGFLCLGSFLL